MANEEIICSIIGRFRNEERSTENIASNRYNTSNHGDPIMYVNMNISDLNITVDNSSNESMYNWTEGSVDRISWNNVTVITKIMIPILCTLGLLANMLHLIFVIRGVSNSCESGQYHVRCWFIQIFLFRIVQ